MMEHSDATDDHKRNTQLIKTSRDSLHRLVHTSLFAKVFGCFRHGELSICGQLLLKGQRGRSCDLRQRNVGSSNNSTHLRIINQQIPGSRKAKLDLLDFWLLYDEHILSKLLVRLGDLLAAIIELGVGFGGLALGDVKKFLIEGFDFLVLQVLNHADGAGDLAKVAEEDAAALAFLFHLLPAIEIHAEFTTDGLQSEAQLLLDFGIAGDGFFRFAGE